MTTIYTGEEGRRIRMIMHENFFESRRKNLVYICIKIILEARSKSDA